MKKRESSLELLRIVSMLMVLTVHFVGAAFGLPTPEDLHAPTASTLWKNALESLAIVGVNCFVLISGYFGIRASWKGLLNYTALCLFASLVVYIFHLFMEGKATYPWQEAVMIYSKTDLWFVPAYLALYLLSPVLNGVRSLTDRQWVLVLSGLLFVNVYLGWCKGGKVNPFGYNEMQMIFMYVVGAALNRYLPLLKQFRSWFYLLCYLVCCALVFGSTFIFTSRVAFAYNAPAVVFASVSLFLVFAVMPSFYNRFINWTASSAFMIYLLHKSPYVWIKIKTFLTTWEATETQGTFLLYAAALFVGIFVVSIFIDQIRKVLFASVEVMFPKKEKVEP